MIIDALTHILPPYFSANRDEAIRRDVTFRELFSNPKAKISHHDELLREMDDAEVDKSVIAGFGWTDPELAMMSNDFNLECALKHGERLIPVCSVNPLWEGDAAATEAERCLDAGAVAIGELHADTQGWVNPPYDALEPLAEVAKRRNAPIIVHASEPVGHAYAGKGSMTPDRLIKLVRRFPENRFIFPHFGGGLPFFEQMPEVKRDLMNVVYDTAAAPFLYESDAYQTVARSAGSNKLMFASDYPVVGQKRSLAHFRAATLDEQSSDAILHLNAMRVFGIR